MKSKYETHVVPKLGLIEAWIRDGVSDRNIARNLGIAYSTLQDYKKDHSDFSALFIRTKEVVDQEMVGAYYRRAIGYTTKETTREYRYIYKHDGTVEKRLVMEKEVDKHIPGDPRAMEWWLSHREKEVWGKVVEVTEEQDVGGVVMIPQKEMLEVPADEGPEIS